MNKLIVLSGIPGSGKSYFTSTLRKVKGSHVYIVSSDGLRNLVCGDPTDMSEDPLMWSIYYELGKVYSIDKNGIVIFDSTNIYKKHRYGAVEGFKEYFDEIDLVIFDIERSLAANQNIQRDYPVPPSVVEQMANDFEKPDEEEKSFFDKILYIKSRDDLAGVVSSLLD